MFRGIALCSILAVVVGCGSNAAVDQSISVDEVPAPLRKIAVEKLPNVTFDRATKRGDGSYEIRGKDKKGKVRDIDLTAGGDVIEIE